MDKELTIEYEGYTVTGTVITGDYGDDCARRGIFNPPIR
jgi:hypothetical protein